MGNNKKKGQATEAAPAGVASVRAVFDYRTNGLCYVSFNGIVSEAGNILNLEAGDKYGAVCLPEGVATEMAEAIKELAPSIIVQETIQQAAGFAGSAEVPPAETEGQE